MTRWGTPSAAASAVLSVTEQYDRKVREIALKQCRCGTGADLETDVVKHEHDDEEHPQAA